MLQKFKRVFFHAICGLIYSLIARGAFAAQPPEEFSAAIGPDLIVSNLSRPISHGYQITESGAVSGLSFGYQFCNIGDESMRYESLPSVHHPLFRSAVYRLKDSRFEQIGISWVYHEYFAVNDSKCDLECTAPSDHDGSYFYAGCSVPNSSIITAYQPNLGPASQINAHTAGFSLPVVHPSGGNSGRIQVNNADLDPAINGGAKYYVEGHCLSSDDAVDGNGHNNASHQRVNVVNATDSPNDSCTGTDPLKFCMFLTDSLYAEQPAIRAWKNQDPEVVETDAQVPGEGLFILSAKATYLQSGCWRYEYALQNLNSDRSGRAFSVSLPFCLDASNVGFHDVDYDGESNSPTDWEHSVADRTITWSTEDYSTNPNANALRWGTLYNFRFDSNAPPDYTTATLTLFKPGTPHKIHIATVGPSLGPPDCNGNSGFDDCDVDCGGVGCCQPCGQSEDCNLNRVPDECEPDCNFNGKPDSCDEVPDANGDGDVDLADISELLQCFTGGPILPVTDFPLPTCCMLFDHDGNSAINLSDFANLPRDLTGPSTP